MSCSGVFSGSVVVLFSVSLVTRSGRKSSSSMCKREFFRNREFSGKIDFNNYFLKLGEYIREFSGNLPSVVSVLSDIVSLSDVSESLKSITSGSLWLFSDVFNNFRNCF